VRLTGANLSKANADGERRMNLRNRKTGETGYYLHTHRDSKTGVLKIAVLKDGVSFSEFKPHEPIYDYDSLSGVNEDWEDYEPVEPIFDEKIRKGIRAWWNMQDNPFKAAAVLCGKEKDLDGFYHWRIFGYIRDGEQKESTDLCFRTKKLYDYNSSHDYTKEELCGEEEE
jgi:hypothetical protein